MKKKMTREQNIITMAHRLGIEGLHAGSKSTTKLLQAIKRVQAAATQTAHYELLAKKREEWKKLSDEEREKIQNEKREDRRLSRQMKKSEKNTEKKTAKKATPQTPEFLKKRTQKKNVRTLADIRKKRSPTDEAKDLTA